MKPDEMKQLREEAQRLRSFGVAIENALDTIDRLQNVNELMKDKALSKISLEIYMLRKEPKITPWGEGFIAGLKRAFHELTDDWNITESEIAMFWQRDLTETKVASQIEEKVE